jgi:hypothetical protein
MTKRANATLSHIPQFRDAGSPVGDLFVSQNFGIRDTTPQMKQTTDFCT